jgi:hypothetical protein
MPILAAVIVTAVSLAGSPSAAYADAGPGDPAPVTAPLALNALACDPDGPTGVDAQLAGALNGTLTEKLAGAMTAYRVSCARMVATAVRNRGLPIRAATIAITTTIVETGIRNLDGGDRDSVGLFQQRDPWGSVAHREDPIWATNAFLDKMMALYPNDSWKTAPIGDVCQKVQVSAFPDRYGQQAADGQRIADAVWPYAAGARPTPHGALWNRTRSAAGAWSSASKIDDNTSITTAAALGLADGSMHVFTVVPGSGIWHRKRSAAGTWDGHATQIDQNGKITGIAATALPDGTMHVFATVPGSGIWHRIRSAAGAWCGATKIDTNGAITRIGAAGLPDGTLHIVALVPGSGLWERARGTDGVWADHAVKIDENESIADVALAGLPDGTLHVMSLVPGSGIWERIRSAADAWAGNAVKIDENGKAVAVSLAGLPDNTMQVDVTVPGGGVWSRSRTSTGAWAAHATQIDLNGKVFDTYSVGLADQTVQVGTLVDAS